jgi:nucleoside 2-deoxyribosyltransferase
VKKRLIKLVCLVLSVLAVVGVFAFHGSGPAAMAEESPAEGKRVYFAGPLFNEAEKEYNLKIVAILESYGYEVFLPQRDGYLAPDLEGKTAEEITEMIFTKDRDEVLKADILFMVLNGRIPDEGACVELGMAYASGKRCYGIKGDSRSIELNMDLNPMISGCFIELFSDLDEDELIRSLKEYLDDHQL